MPDNRMICRVCHRPIDRVFGATSHDQPREEWTFEGYVHLDRKPETPHDPDPIPAEEADFIDQVCDFCGQPDIAWVFPVDPDEMRFLTPSITINDTAWAACQSCYEIIEHERFDAARLAKHIIQRHPSAKALPSGHIKNLYQRELTRIYNHFMKVKRTPVTLNEFIS